MKMNKILFGGCSLTWGDELNSFSREKQRYSHIVSKYFNAEEINVSSNAISIPHTIYKLYDAIKEDSNIDNPQEDILKENEVEEGFEDEL